VVELEVEMEVEMDYIHKIPVELLQCHLRFQRGRQFQLSPKHILRHLQHHLALAPYIDLAHYQLADLTSTAKMPFQIPEDVDVLYPPDQETSKPANYPLVHEY